MWHKKGFFGHSPIKFRMIFEKRCLVGAQEGLASLEEFVCFAGFSALLSPRQTRHKTTAKKNKSHLLKEIFLICHVQGQDVPKNVNFQNTAGDQKS